MADRKSGPVKPPVIDLTARDATQAPSGDGKPAQRRAPARSSSRAKAGTAARPEDAPTLETAPTDASPTPEAAAAEDQPTASQPPEAPPTPEPPEAPQQPQPQPSVPPPPRPQARLAMPWSAISIAAIAGALLGAGLTYLLAAWIALPSSAPPIPDPAPELAEQSARLTGLVQRLAALEEASVDTQVSLDATIAQLDTGFADLRRSIGEVRAAIPPPTTVDLSGIEAELRTLESRLDATAAGASSEDAAALAQSLAALTTRLSGLDLQMTQTDATIEGLAADLAAARTAIAAQTRSIGGADVGPAVKLPLIVSGLESAFAAGRPYPAELRSLTAILPDLSVPATLEANAQAGLARPDHLANRFSAAVPAILAGRTGSATGDLGQDALEWAKALLALRPAGEIEGNTPEAVISRLEGAMQRRDFIAAAALLGQLPEPMRRAAGPLAAEIEAHAEAEAFIAALRAQALAPTAETAQ